MTIAKGHRVINTLACGLAALAAAAVARPEWWWWNMPTTFVLGFALGRLVKRYG